MSEAPPATPSAAERTAERLRALMAERGYDGTDLAAALDVSASGASRRYNGKQPLSINELATASEWLGEPLHALLPGPATTNA